MILNDAKIIELVEKSQMIEPFNQILLQSHSYDLCLDKQVQIPIADKKGESVHKRWELKDISHERFYINPGQFLLAATVEYLKLPENIVGMVSGKSTIGRSGLQIENAGWVDANFSGAITLELSNLICWPLRLIPGQAICQIIFMSVEAPVYKFYKQIGHYNGQRGPTLPYDNKQQETL